MNVRFHDTRRTLFAVSVLAGAALAPDLAHAFTAAADGDFAYQLYDVGVNKIAKGPIGQVAAVGLIVFGITQIFRSWIMATGGFLAGAGVAVAGNMPTTMGLVL